MAGLVGLMRGQPLPGVRQHTSMAHVATLPGWAPLKSQWLPVHHQTCQRVQLMGSRWPASLLRCQQVTLRANAVPGAKAAPSQPAVDFMGKYTDELLGEIRQELEGRYTSDSLVTVLLTDLQQLAELQACPPDEYMRKLLSHTLPATDGSFQDVFLELVEHLHVLGYTPPLAWLQQLDRAVVAYCSDDDLLPLYTISPAQTRALLGLMTHDVSRSKTPPAVMMTPILIEARCQQPRCPAMHLDVELPGRPGEPELLVSQVLEAYHDTVRQQQANYPSRRCPWNIQHMNQLLAARGAMPLVRRWGHTFEAMDVSTFLMACLTYGDELAVGGGDAAFQEVQDCMTAALTRMFELLSTQLGSHRLPINQMPALAPRPPPTSNGSSAAVSPDSNSKPLDASDIEELCKDVRQSCTFVLFCMTQSANPSVGMDVWDSQLLKCLAGVLLAAYQLAERLETPLEELNEQDCIMLDLLGEKQDDPDILVPITLLQSQQPDCWLPDSQGLHTPVRLLTVMAQHLDWFSDTQLTQVLKALGRACSHSHSPQQESGQEPSTQPLQPLWQNETAAKVQQLLCGAAGSDAARAARKQHQMPDDFLDYVSNSRPSQGPAVDEDPTLDLLARVGVRLSRSLAGKSVAEQQEVLEALGLSTPASAAGN